MDLLVLGGTRFVGRHLVEAALARGHRVTLFHRGRSGLELFPGCERVLGDREQDLGRLSGRRFDAVADTCGYVPRLVAGAAGVLGGAVGRYLFVSTISVYADFSVPRLDEGAPLAPPPDPPTEDPGAGAYGALKVLCESALRERLGGRATVLRPGLVAGPWDPTERLTAWPRRAARGGEMAVPGDPDRCVQYVDARDLAAFAVHLLEADQEGTFNVVVPPGTVTMGGLLAASLEATGSSARLHWIPDPLLEARGIQPLSGSLRLWIPRTLPGLGGISVERALAAGFRPRPVIDTVRDTWAWARDRQPEGGPGLEPAEEAALLEAVS